MYSVKINYAYCTGTNLPPLFWWYRHDGDARECFAETNSGTDKIGYGDWGSEAEGHIHLE